MIEKWLESFKTKWLEKDIDAVLDLFTPEVEYWETPFRRVNDMEALKNEWTAILGQSDIRLELRLFSAEGEKYTVSWELTYTDAEGELRNWAGVYLIKLDMNGKCTYFYQTGESY